MAISASKYLLTTVITLEIPRKYIFVHLNYTIVPFKVYYYTIHVDWVILLLFILTIQKQISLALGNGCYFTLALRFAFYNIFTWIPATNLMGRQ